MIGGSSPPHDDAYWTAERMASAVPRELHVEPPADAEDAEEEQPGPAEVDAPAERGNGA